MKVMVLGLFLLAATGLAAEPGDWKQIGEKGLWEGTVLAAGYDGTLYTVEKDGHLYSTDLKSGDRTTVGDGFDTAKLLFVNDEGLFVVTEAGELDQVDRATGKLTKLKVKQKFAGASFADGIGQNLFIVDGDGNLFKVDVVKKVSTRLGSETYAAAKATATTDTRLFILDTEGTLYKIDPADGSREIVGKETEYKNSLAIAGSSSALYSAETDNKLWVTTPDDGAVKSIGKDEFGDTTFMIYSSGLFTIEKDGSLFEIEE